jgi:hypothetical protein
MNTDKRERSSDGHTDELRMGLINDKKIGDKKITGPAL